MKLQRSWVTYASENSEGIKALMLAKSLRRVITTNDITIFISTQVSEEIRDLLEEDFSRCIRINEPSYGLSFATIARIHAWKLHRLEKFVFVDCNCMVLRNSDELFSTTGLGFIPIPSELHGHSNILTSSVITDVPSKTKFTKIWESLQLDSTWNSGKPKDNLLAYEGKHLDERYNVLVNGPYGNLAKNPAEINIVNFTTDHPVNIAVGITNGKHPLENAGILEKEIYQIGFGLLGKGGFFQKAASAMKVELKNGDIPRCIKEANLEYFVPDQLETLKNSIAIVGMAFRLPGANNISEFWNLLKNGEEGIIRVPENRWSNDHCFTMIDGVRKVEAGFLKCPIDEVDGKFFGLSPAELSFVDPQQRLTLHVMHEALENAGINPPSLKNSNTGVFGGWWRNDYKEMLQEEGLNEQDFFRTYMGNSLGTLTGRISHILETTGPSVPTESGCSTSMVAVDMACKSLLNEDCDLSITFGVNLLLHPFTVQLNEIIAVDGRCKTFDAGANGFGRAEGCAVLILKRFSDAVKNGDRIWALIRGSAVVQEGLSKSMGTPTKQCEALAMELALADAGVQPSEVSFVETHGTGTAVGDPLEVAAVTEVYSQGRKEPLVIGSVKTNIGHTESCSGIAGIIKTVLALQNEMIPPHRNFTNLNPEINLEAIPAILPLTPCQWEKHADTPRIAGVSSFGITGTDAHVIVQEVPALPPRGLNIKSDGQTQHILTISAKSEEALDEITLSYEAFLNDTTEQLTDITYTSNISRSKYPLRSVIIGKNAADMAEKIQSRNIISGQVSKNLPKICFLFTGQGSQYHGMAKDLYDQNLTFKLHFDYCNKVLQRDFGISIVPAIWGDKNESNLEETIYSQTSIFCIEYCLLKLWESWGVKPDVVLGHSLGEFAAAVAAGILKIEDALKLVAERSRLIHSLPGGKMIVLKADHTKVDTFLKTAFQGTDKWLDYAAVNSPDQVVLAGGEEDVLSFAQFCNNNNIKTHVLNASHAFHSRHMEPILEDYEDIASTIIYSNPTCTYISGMEGRKINSEEEIDESYWVKHTRDQVRFMNASKLAVDEGCTLFLEIGPQPVLSALTLINSDECTPDEPITCLPSLRKSEENWTTILNSLGKLYISGVNINWNNYNQYFSSKIVDLPLYRFQTKPYWIKGLKTETAIHTLVGTQMESPSSDKIFRNVLSLTKAQYLADHVVGEKIIFPGAGFLEMCSVAAYAATQCTESSYTPPVSPFTIEDFTIESPLGLVASEATQSQVIVSSEENGETRSTIYSKLTLDKETHKWIRHASGLYQPFAVKWNSETLYKNDTLDHIKNRCSEKLETEKTYGDLETVGLKFGPAFQTLQNAWKGEDEILVEVQTTQSPEAYTCHPVIIDAMFQAMMFARGKDKEKDIKKLCVPVSVNKFIWYHKMETNTCYIHGRKGDGADTEQTAVLYDNLGNLCAVMINPELIETTVSTIMSTLEGQKASLPSMYEEIWREQRGPLDQRPNEWFNEEVVSVSFNSSVNLMQESDDEKAFYIESNRLYLNYMIKAMHELGWNIQLGDTFALNDLKVQLKVIPAQEGLLRYICMELAKESYLQTVIDNRENMSFKLIKELPSLNITTSNIHILYESLKPEENVDVKVVSQTASKLAPILTGEENPLPILFPEGKQSNAELYYIHSKLMKGDIEKANHIIPKILENTDKALNGPVKKVARILEVGAGTGSFTGVIRPYLESIPSCYEYTYTDISPVFFSYGEKVFKDSKIQVIYKTLNIEEDPLSQGFLPQHYDIICANYVVHATRDIKESLSNMKNLLRPGGVIVLTELITPYRAINLFFGTIDGFWRFQDFHLRSYACEMEPEKWNDVFTQIGFDQVAVFPGYMGHSAALLAYVSHKSQDTPFLTDHLPKTPQKVWMLFGNEECDSSTYFTSNIASIDRKVIIVTNSHMEKVPQDNPETVDGNLRFKIGYEDPTEIQKIFDYVKNSGWKLEGVAYLWGLNCNNDNYAPICRPYFELCKILAAIDANIKLVVYTKGLICIGDTEVCKPSCSPLWGITRAMQNEQFHIKCRCVDLDPQQGEFYIEEGFKELFNNDGEVSIAYRKNKRHVLRLTTYRVPKNSLEVPKSERFHLVLPQSNALSDLKFAPIGEKPELGDNEVEIRVETYALNFRDLFAVLKPDAQFDSLNTVGIDYAGVVTRVGSSVQEHKIGNSVFGINLNGDALGSHIISDAESVLPIPDNMTYSQASTLPAVAATAFQCLVQTAKLKEGETVLIHTGSGGVGLAAIQLAQSLKCNIVTTAGSNRKRAYLRNLGIKHVFHSRNTDYEKGICEALGGPMVDVVLNSLTGPGFKEATLAVCKQGARFIEMSKLNTWTVEEVKALRPDVSYEIVDLSSADEETVRKYMRDVKKHLQDSKINPIPYVRYDASEIREALTCLQKAKHIGKIVCVMPQPTQKQSAGRSASNVKMFNENATYLITGGMGGIGREVAKWMGKSGAKHIVLVGRNLPTENTLEDIRFLKSQGVNTICMQCDVGHFEQCKGLLDNLKSESLSLPPLRGIMHVAGVLADATFDNQVWENYEKVFNAKVRGGWNLHTLTLDYALEHFVMFSSGVANFGSLGQGNHAGANYYLDSLTQYRHSIGLPATTINWGQWGQVGVAAHLEMTGVRPFTALQGISALESVMKHHQLQTFVVEGDFSILGKFMTSAKKYLSELAYLQRETKSDIKVDAEEFWKAYDAAETDDERYEIIRNQMIILIRHILKLDKDDVIDDNATFQDMGMDSLMMIEMKNTLQSVFKNRVKITLSSVKDCNTVRQLAERLVNLIAGAEKAPLTPEELAKLIEEDSKLPIEIIPPGPACDISEIHTLFITGVTGNLGPHILHELCKRSEIQRIICLVRPSKDDQTPLERLKKLLIERELFNEIRFDLIECLAGNVAKEHFGLNEEVYKKLCQEVDAILHLSVNSNVMDPYRKVEKSISDVRSVNVTGIKNVLEFACNTRTKHLFGGSTVVAVTSIGENGTLNENWPSPDEFKNAPNAGYATSKFIADRLMAQATERGLPCKAFRFPEIGGHSKNGGQISVLSNHLILRMLTYFYVGAVPAYPVPFTIVPVDTCAQISCRIFFNPDAAPGMYNLTNPFTEDEQIISELANDFGYSVERVEPDEMMEKVKKLDDSELLILAKRAIENKEEREKLENNIPDAIAAWMAKRENVFLSRKLEKLIPEYPHCLETSFSLLKKDLEFAKKCGMFKKFGLK